MGSSIIFPRPLIGIFLVVKMLTTLFFALFTVGAYPEGAGARRSTGLESIAASSGGRACSARRCGGLAASNAVIATAMRLRLPTARRLCTARAGTGRDWGFITLAMERY